MWVLNSLSSKVFNFSNKVFSRILYLYDDDRIGILISYEMKNIIIINSVHNNHRNTINKNILKYF